MGCYSAIIYRYRTGIARRDPPEVFELWQAVWTHHRMVTESPWNKVHAKLTATEEAVGLVE